jgi:hypothetical protein
MNLPEMKLPLKAAGVAELGTHRKGPPKVADEGGSHLEFSMALGIRDFLLASQTLDVAKERLVGPLPRSRTRSNSVRTPRGNRDPREKVQDGDEDRECKKVRPDARLKFRCIKLTNRA